MTTADRIELARELYERAVFGGDADALVTADRALDGVEADLALARGRVLHARYLAEEVEDPRELELFERAAELYRQLGDERGEGEARFWVGCLHQVIRGDGDAAAPAFARARELATRAGDKLTLSYVLRHLAFLDQAAGRLDATRQLMEESTRLRREVGFLPGVAANLLALGYLAAEQGDPEGALGLVDEATQVAEACSAHGIVRWAEEARTDLAPAGEGAGRP
ncbi:tetratricopeptide repeat protein [Micromonospora sp. HK10]|uniref:tetratricopeptide repeat protein n=1 Tax=Micromonospora sp. HK10 TaxID=1538294 RepID=UPI0006270E7E|nr:tetratricopeptide repeat protein [Micromonospora sp. HK10]KKK06245.1 tetratricopeptide repeat protein [Micromonospora sp. HK10]